MHTREKLLVFFLSGQIHLSKKDYGFFSNLKYIISDNKHVTTNQNKLFEKLIVKYQRQLLKCNHDPKTLLDLKWQIPVVPTIQEYLDAKFYIENDELIIKAPFNPTFLQSFRKISNNPFIWDRNRKLYYAPYSTYALKIGYNSLKKFYENVKLMGEIEELVNTILSYTDTFWNPTLKKIKDNFYILCANPYLLQNISDVTLDDDPKTLFKLSEYGVLTDKEITYDDPLKKFASEYFTEIDLINLGKFVEYLKALDIKYIKVQREILYNKSIFEEIKSLLNENGITITSGEVPEGVRPAMIQHNKYPELYLKDVKNICKFITVRNSREINIR